MALLFPAVVAAEGSGLSVADPAALGEKIFRNECSSNDDKLVCWNKGEEFVSCGIGHFIWYPDGYKGPFRESFPDFLDFASAGGVEVPVWMKGPCPWNSYEEFARSSGDGRIAELKYFLISTKALQAEFIVERFKGSLPLLLESFKGREREKIRARIDRLLAEPNGVYALVDYSNFKGAGTSLSERYNGTGWGLAQVLKGMKDDTVADFVRSAKEALNTRVRNSPAGRNEARWLPGWLKRVESYLEY